MQNQANQITYQQNQTDSVQLAKNSSRRVATQQLQFKKNQVQDITKTQNTQCSNQFLTTQPYYINLHNKISQEIFKGKIQISQNQIDFPLYSYRSIMVSKNDGQPSLKQKLQEMERKREETIKILKSIQQEQMDIKRKSISFRKKTQQNNAIRKERSYYSPEEKTKVKKAISRNVQLQKQLRYKTLQALKRYQKASLEQKQRRIQQIQKQRNLHRSFVQQNMKSLQIKKKQRLQSFSASKKNYQQIKNRKYLYQNKLQKQQQLLQELDYQMSKKLEQIKNRMKQSTAQQIKEHQNKYNQIIKSKIQNKKNLGNSHFSKLGNLGQPLLTNSLVKKIQDNYFSQLIKTQIIQRKEQQENAKKKPLQYKLKVKQFSKRVESEIKPKLKITKESAFVPNERNSSVHSLNYDQQRKKGHHYLTIAKKLKKCQTLEQEKLLDTKISTKISEQINKNKYRNYLKQMRRFSEENPESSRRQFNHFLQKQGTITEYNSLTKAVFVAESMEAKSKRSKDQKLIDSVQNKINLLKMIS